MEQIIWNDWCFAKSQEEPIFGKMRIEAIKGEIEEVFYVYGEELTLLICEELFERYLYVYGD